MRWQVLAALAAAVASCGGMSDTTGDLLAGLDHVFPQDRVVEIKVGPDGGWDALVQAFLTGGKMDYVTADFSFDQEHLDPVGLRVNGNVVDGEGQEEPKYSLRLHFDEFGGDLFHLVEKVNLGNNKPDPSVLREALAGRFYAAMGVPVSRTAFANVTADGEALGLYVMVEDVDKRFLKEHFGTKSDADDGNLYKCVPDPPCTLAWNGDSKGGYFFPTCHEPDGCGLVQRTNEDDPAQNDYADLVAFLDVLNHSSDADFYSAIDNAFEVDLFLRYVAVAVVISDYDSYLSTLDNFYLYHRPDTGKFVFLPWDHNKAFGAQKCKGSQERSGGPVEQPWCGGEARPLVERILAVPTYADDYRGYVKQVLDTWLTEANMEQWIAEYDALVHAAVAADQHSFYSFAEYEQALTAEATEKGPMNLLEFVKARRAYLEKQL